MSAHAPRPFTGRHMLAVLVAFFGVVIAVNIALAVFASRSWTGLVVANSYVASQHYNEAIAERRAEEALGWKVGIDKADGLVTITARDGESAPLTGLSISVEAGHPVEQSNDHALTVTELGGGTYRTNEPLPAGVWNLAIHLARGERTVTERVRLVMPKAD